AEPFFPGDGVTGRERKAVPDVEVAVAVLQIRTGAMLQIGSETIQGSVVEAMTVGVTGGEIQPVRHALGHGRLQAIVVGPGKILREVNETKGAEAGKRSRAEPHGRGAALIIGTDARLRGEGVENERML